jgi:hypothetical protein
MVTEQSVVARHEARMQLLRLGQALRNRDQIIAGAARLGLTHSEIADLLGCMDRSRVSQIVNGRK